MQTVQESGKGILGNMELFWSIIEEDVNRKSREKCNINVNKMKKDA